MKKLQDRLLKEKLNLNDGDYEVVQLVKGAALQGNYFRLFPESGNQPEGKIIHSDQVSSEDGSGIVHIAPGHGDIDYKVGHGLFGLPVVSPVNDGGKFSDEVGVPELKGLFVLKGGNEKVLEILKANGSLVHHETIRHSYPHCWRCKSPVIFRATYQWFLNVEHEQLRARLLDEIKKVKWTPDYGQNRIEGMINSVRLVFVSPAFVGHADSGLYCRAPNLCSTIRQSAWLKKSSV